ncbi:hypothetical protein [Trichocoleus desertorum]
MFQLFCHLFDSHPDVKGDRKPRLGGYWGDTPCDRLRDLSEIKAA